MSTTNTEALTPKTCPVCGSDCNELDELIKAEREIERLTAAQAAREPMSEADAPQLFPWIEYPRMIERYHGIGAPPVCKVLIQPSFPASQTVL